MQEENGLLNRKKALKRLEDQVVWDIIVIGGGATGLGVAVDAASRGYSTLLLEQSDFAKGTSSRSTKLVHGGVRYLAQGNIKLVYDALRERGILMKNAPHIVKKQAFVIPCYSLWDKIKYLTGLKLYDWLSGRFSFGRSKYISKNKMTGIMPGIRQEKLVGGIEYYDGQFDDARLAINLAETSAANGGVTLNYFKVNQLLKENNKICGVIATDIETGKPYHIQSKTVINATGVFVDDILCLDTPGKKPIVQPSQGVHLVFDKSFLNSEAALMIPETADGRVLFAVPWHNHVLVGTTDTPLNKHTLEPRALEAEIDFILKTVRQYFSKAITRKDVLSVFAGLRPLAAPQKETDSTKEISRDHKLMVSPSGLITITGGKWTTYRQMAEVTVNKAIEVGHLKKADCKTAALPIHGSATVTGNSDYSITVYGSDYKKIQALANEDHSLNNKIIEGFPYTWANAIWAVRHEMARTVEDVLARRLRLLFLDAAAALDAAPVVADLMAGELEKDASWKKEQLESFKILAANYLLKTDQKMAIHKN
ncbi:glycerol-3-phosphate dehydrogenase [Parafilimonas terrae]|uniref:Glycerol-3-phosphate dehydrogenase n=1 Tax=Parafilimonas terrae TaxID=1465490 RepID=A0A1I5RN23_9BACT|nr:glycerol-3-phosphate dehydrogenase [Parafilimonas terrae]